MANLSLPFLFLVLVLLTTVSHCSDNDRYQTFMDLSEHCSAHITAASSSQFTKFIFIIIDALRVDFVPTLLDPESTVPRMPFLESTLKSHGIGLTSVASTPTVTLPRLKALLSGAVPSFRDYVLNLNAYAFTEDNLVSTLARRGQRIVFFGDDTWGHLFGEEPEVFIRTELTSSFYVSDTVTVDTNVTRNVVRELEHLEDWDVMILHYLGLDHLGHGFGYGSPLMVPKLAEMDEIIKMVFETLVRANVSVLIAVTGDHGMTNAGNHGGATKEETDTALIFLSTNPAHARDPANFSTHFPTPMRRFQIDFAPTLATLLRLPIPQVNRGTLIGPILERFSEPPSTVLCALFENAIQIQHVIPAVPENTTILTSLKTTLDQALVFHERYHYEENRTWLFTQSAAQYGKFLDSVQANFVSKNTEEAYNVPVLILLLVGIVGTILGLFWIEWQNSESIFFKFKKNEPESNQQNSSAAIYTSFESRALAFAFIAGNVIAMSSTNFIQNEHYFWNALVGVIVGVAVVDWVRKHNRPSNYLPSLILLTALLPFLFRWRVTILSSQWGDASDEDPNDLYTRLIKPENRAITSVIFGASLATQTWILLSRQRLATSTVYTSGLVLAYVYRSQIGTLTPLFTLPLDSTPSANIYAQFVYLHALVLLGLPLLSWIFPSFGTGPNSKRHTNPILPLLLTLSLISVLLLDPATAPILPLNILAEQELYKILSSGLTGPKFQHQLFPRLVFYLAFAYSGFYQIGNSNSLSTVSVTSCFIGLNSYELGPCTILMIVSTYSTHLFWILAFFRRLYDDLQNYFDCTNTKHDLFNSVLACFLLIRLGVVFTNLTVTLVLRTHPYIWSVLSPKLLYELLFLALHFLASIGMSVIFILKFRNK